MSSRISGVVAANPDAKPLKGTGTPSETALAPISPGCPFRAESALRILAHLAGAGWLWHARLRGVAPRLAVWPELDLDACARELDALAAAWAAYLEALDAESLGASVDYVNSKGERFTSG